MGRRWVYLPLVALLGAAAAVLPAVASSESGATVEAVSSGYSFAWLPGEASIGAGANVKFVNSSTTVPHGIVWKTAPATPACEEGTGKVPVGVGKWATHWEGSCTFGQAGTYSYYCSYHGEPMSGTVTVGSNGTVTTTTTATSPPSPPPPTTTMPPPGPESPLAGPASQALKIAKSQRGGVVKGSIDISKAGTGDRLEVDVFAANASLARTKHRGRVRVGRLIRSSVPAGPHSFSVKLAPKARRALKRRHRLALTVKVTLTPLYGETLTIVRTVVER